jgi:hypothetical protein
VGIVLREVDLSASARERGSAQRPKSRAALAAAQVTGPGTRYSDIPGPLSFPRSKKRRCAVGD